MDALLNAHRALAMGQAQSFGQPRYGLVTSYDPNAHAAKVTIQPEGVQTGWLPVESGWSGGGWGLIAPLAPGDQVIVDPVEGAMGGAVVRGRVYSDQQRPPAPPATNSGAAPGPAATLRPGECALVGQAGQVLRLCADGTIYMQAPVNILGAVTIQGNLSVTGTSTMTGNMSVTGSIASTGDQVAAGISQTGHVHGGVQTGGGNTAGPH